VNRSLFELDTFNFKCLYHRLFESFIHKEYPHFCPKICLNVISAYRTCIGVKNREFFYFLKDHEKLPLYAINFQRGMITLGGELHKILYPLWCVKLSPYVQEQISHSYFHGITEELSCHKFLLKWRNCSLNFSLNVIYIQIILVYKHYQVIFIKMLSLWVFLKIALMRNSVKCSLLFLTSIYLVKLVPTWLIQED
jgi:hypothetical protein